MTTTVFVYGTLLKGEGNHRVLRGGTFVRAARTRPDLSMFTLGAFPGVSRGGTTAIEGELYVVDDAVLARLDALEGHPRFYCREEITLDDGQVVSAYLLPREPYADREPIASGSWRQHRAQAKRERGPHANRTE